MMQFPIQDLKTELLDTLSFLLFKFFSLPPPPPNLSIHYFIIFLLEYLTAFA